MDNAPPPDPGPARRRSERDLEILASIGRKLLGGVDLDQQLGLTVRLAVEKARLYATLREREERVSGLLEAAINAQEAERRRIADEMHDGFLQALTGLFLQTEIAKATLGRAGTAEAMAALDSVQDAILR